MGRGGSPLQRGREVDLLVLGGAGVDTVVRVPALPVPPADSIAVPAIVTRAGQTGDGVAVGARALGLRVGLIDLIGDDDEGRLVRRLHADAGVEFTALTTAAGTKRAVNLVEPSGGRLSFYDVERVPTEPVPWDDVLAAATAARHVHVSITQPWSAAPRRLAGLGVTVSTDLHDWDGVSEYHEPFALGADVVTLSAAALTDVDSTLHRILDAGRARVAVATAGSDGCYVLERGVPGVRHLPPAPLPGPAVDSNGAGDAFVAGFLYGMFAGEPVDECCRLGAIAGAHACTVPAHRLDPLSRAELEARRDEAAAR